MPETGWSKTGIYQYYVMEHLAKHAQIKEHAT